MDLDRLSRRIQALENQNSVPWATAAGSAIMLHYGGTNVAISPTGQVACNDIFVADNISPDNEERLSAVEDAIDLLEGLIETESPGTIPALTEIRETLEDHEDRITANEEARDDHEERIGNLEETVQEQSSRIDGAEEIAEEHDERITALEESNEDHEGRITAVEETNEDHEGRITALEEINEDHEGRITTLEETNEDHEGRITALEETNEEYGGRITTLEETNEDHEGRINNIEDFLETGGGEYTPPDLTDIYDRLEVIENAAEITETEIVPYLPINYFGKTINSIVGTNDNTTEEVVNLMSFEYYEAHKWELMGMPGADGEDGEDGDDEGGKSFLDVLGDIFDIGTTIIGIPGNIQDIVQTVQMIKNYIPQLRAMGGSFFSMIKSKFMGYSRILGRSIVTRDSPIIPDENDYLNNPFDVWPDLHGNEIDSDDMCMNFLEYVADEYATAVSELNQYIKDNNVEIDDTDDEDFGWYSYILIAYLFMRNHKHSLRIEKEMDNKADINHGHDFNVKQDTLTLNMSNVNVTVNIKKVDDLEARISALENSFSSPK